MDGRQLCLLALLIGSLSISACSKTDYGLETTPLTGEVYVDGNPAAELAVTLHNVAGMDSEVPTVSATFTKEDGTFEVSTFEEGDGVPAGDYVATFAWGQFNPVSRRYEKDKLKGKYADPKTSEFKVTVSGGEPVDMGRIELRTN